MSRRCVVACALQSRRRMHIGKLCSSAFLVVPLVVATSRPAARAGELGAAGQVVLTCPLESASPCVAAGRTSDGGHNTRVRLGADVFVRDGWSLGAALRLDEYATTGEYAFDQRSIDGELRLGRAVAVARHVTLWPQLGVGHSSMSGSDTVWPVPDYNRVLGRVLVALTPLPHVVFGLAPTLTVTRPDNQDVTYVGLGTDVLIGAAF